MANTQLQQITDKDFGNMYLIYDKILIVRSANSIGLYKYCKGDDHDEEEEEEPGWEEYYTFEEMRG